jgi:hypothetical protein
MSDAPQPERRPNLVLWVSIGVPLATIVASAITLYVSYSKAEPELPAQYSWEGSALDADLARAAEAQRLGAAVDLDFSADGLVQARLQFANGAQDPPSTLELRLTHATLPALDRSVTLARDSADGHYSAKLEALARGHWLVQLDAGKQWRLRKEFDAPTLAVRLGR